MPIIVFDNNRQLKIFDPFACIDSDVCFESRGRLCYIPWFQTKISQVLSFGAVSMGTGIRRGMMGNIYDDGLTEIIDFPRMIREVAFVVVTTDC